MIVSLLGELPGISHGEHGYHVKAAAPAATALNTPGWFSTAALTAAPIFTGFILCKIYHTDMKFCVR
jgi:hypothetical protein